MHDHYAVRREKLVSRLRKNSLEFFLVTDEINVSYLTGFSGDDTVLLLGPKGATLLSDSRYEQQIAEETAGLDVFIRRSGQSMNAALAEVFSRTAGHQIRLGVESGSMSLLLAEKIAEALPAAELVPVSSAVETLREIKDRSEIAAIRSAIRCAVRAFNVIRCSLEPGQTEIEIRNELEHRMRLFGADDRGFPSIVAVGPRAALPHAVPTHRWQVQDSELLLIDWGAKKNAYVSDLTRVLITTCRPTLKLKRIYDTVLRAQRTAIASIRPGVAAHTVDTAARKVIARAGYAEAFGHGLGHGLGRVVHDRGGLSVGNKTLLRPGMVLTVEPGIYLPGWGGVRIEDDVLVTRNGVEILTESLPKSFEEMIVDF